MVDVPFLVPAHQTVHAVLPHTAYRRSSPAAFDFPGPRRPGPDDDPIETDQAQVIRREQHLARATRTRSQEVIAHPGVTLTCWQHGEILAIAEALSAVSPPPPSRWPNDRFDVVWTLTPTPDGWHLAQLPELALPQDQASVVPD
jgi:hypothetical protein